MVSGKLAYLQSFLDAVDDVESGRKGAISDSRELVLEYRPEYYSVLETQLKNPSSAVRKEVVLL